MSERKVVGKKFLAIWLANYQMHQERLAILHDSIKVRSVFVTWRRKMERRSEKEFDLNGVLEEYLERKARIKRNDMFMVLILLI